MIRFEIILIVFALLALISATSSAQYWFQTGARGSDSAAFNNGARVSIETVYQNVSYGSLGFWVGEDLDNGAFVQIGYEIVNQSGKYPTNCSPSGCANNTYLQAGVPTWFWEYFPAGYSGSAFYGGIGQSGSAGPNGSFNTYSFTSLGNIWHFYFNNMLVGSVDLGTSSSGASPPVAFGEYAGAETNTAQIGTVAFRNLEFYNDNKFLLVPGAYTFIGYGKGSETMLPNEYGIKEVNNYVDYFAVGSGLPLQNHTTLWEFGYILKVSSQYGNLTYEGGNYSAYVPVSISAPKYIYTGNGTREAFEGWKGAGSGSYTGANENATIMMDSNISEETLWQAQYMVNVSNGHGVAVGSGWYASGAIAQIGVSTRHIGTGAGSRIGFEGWTNGYKGQNFTFAVASSETFSPVWQQQYLVNATAKYGSVDGNGWYNESSTATLSLTERNMSVSSSEKEGFYAWSNGSIEEPLSFAVSKPVFISALYGDMFLTELKPVNANNASIGNIVYNINGENHSSNYVYLFSGTTYNIEYATYKGTAMGINQHMVVSSPQAIYVRLPIYNVSIQTRSFFGMPVNASLEIAFKNGTKVDTYTGSSGILMLSNVPYGYVSGYASVLGIKQSIETSFGSNSNLTMLTPFAAAMIALGILAVFASVIVGEIIERRRKASASPIKR